MNGVITRPATRLEPDRGLLRADQFQMAYATNDIDRACALFRERLGIREFTRLEGAMPEGGHIRVELAWAGSTMYELIMASGPGSELFMDRLPEGGEFTIRHHHLGFLLPDEASWDALMGEIERGGWRMTGFNHNVGFMRRCFVAVPHLDHYLEYILPEPAGAAFLEAVAAS
ncbi:MAG TPA: VOC family protein [Sphingobium sp.]|uniref:VOC family protein n=1 Tax=Sphingobium sp. TaxID=1912891 RepID=UPI002ED5EE2D